MDPDGKGAYRYDHKTVSESDDMSDHKSEAVSKGQAEGQPLHHTSNDTLQVRHSSRNCDGTWDIATLRASHGYVRRHLDNRNVPTCAYTLDGEDSNNLSTATCPPLP